MNCIIFTLEGCSVCETLKKTIDQLKSRCSNVEFNFIQLNADTENLYKKLNPAKSPIIDYVNNSGELKRKFLRDSNGKIIVDVPLQAPNLFVFHKDAKTEQNPEGFLFNIADGNIENISKILNDIREML